MTKRRVLNSYRGESWFWFMGSYLPASIVYTAAVQAAFRVLERSPSVTAQTRCSHKRTDGPHGPSPKAAPPGFVALAGKCRWWEKMRNSFHASTLVWTPRRMPACWVRGCVPAGSLVFALVPSGLRAGFCGMVMFHGRQSLKHPEAKQNFCVFERKLCAALKALPPNTTGVSVKEWQLWKVSPRSSEGLPRRKCFKFTETRVTGRVFRCTHSCFTASMRSLSSRTDLLSTCLVWATTARHRYGGVWKDDRNALACWLISAYRYFVVLNLSLSLSSPVSFHLLDS